MPISASAATSALHARLKTEDLNRYLACTNPSGTHRLASINGQPPDWANLSRKETTALQQLQVNRAKYLEATHFRWGLAYTPSCPHCDCNEEDTTHFLLHCPRWDRERLATLGPHADLSCLQTDPSQVVRFLYSCARL